MKKSLTLLLSAAFILLSCSTKEPVPAAVPSVPEEAPVTTADRETYYLTYHDVKLYTDLDVTDMTTLLGEPTKYFESESCAFQGLDKVYTYGGLMIYTYPDGELDRLLSMDLRDDTIQTAEGAYVGASEEMIVSLYGEDAEKTDEGIYVARKGGTVLTFFVKSGMIDGITYTKE